MDLTAVLTFSYCSWQDLQPAPRTLMELMLFALDPQKQEVLSSASGAEAQQQPLVALSLGSEAPQQLYQQELDCVKEITHNDNANGTDCHKDTQ